MFNTHSLLNVSIPPHQHLAAIIFYLFKVRDHNAKNGTIKWHSIRRQKREWIKFAAACREGEDNSKRNPIAKVSENPEHESEQHNGENTVLEESSFSVL